MVSERQQQNEKDNEIERVKESERERMRYGEREATTTWNADDSWFVFLFISRVTGCGFMFMAKKIFFKKNLIYKRCHRNESSVSQLISMMK